MPNVDLSQVNAPKEKTSRMPVRRSSACHDPSVLRVRCASHAWQARLRSPMANVAKKIAIKPWPLNANASADNVTEVRATTEIATIGRYCSQPRSAHVNTASANRTTSRAALTRSATIPAWRRLGPTAKTWPINHRAQAIMTTADSRPNAQFTASTAATERMAPLWSPLLRYIETYFVAPSPKPPPNPLAVAAIEFTSIHVPYCCTPSVLSSRGAAISMIAGCET